ncbi:uncharacterized protein PAC_11307 [Phialocephala subalpina]|uniref:Uncharacterized protein n=1 Tax=Phialocephala subalpina TaxID=576137 RepID=A0A1L7X8R0_9HELO|nr:uncharacterized protein PAC_11307 [Phialocephala subalpina]
MANLLRPPLKNHLSQNSSALSSSPSRLNYATSSVVSQSRSSQSTVDNTSLPASSPDADAQHTPQEHARRHPDRTQARRQNNSITLHPIPVPEGYHELNFRPFMLRTSILVSMLAFNTLCVVSLFLVVYKSDVYDQFHSSHPDMRFVVRYVPTIVGTVTTLFFRSMNETLSRIKSYICMANAPDNIGSPGSKSVGLMYTGGLYWGNMKKRLSPRHQDWLRWVMFFASIPIAQITGYKAALFTASVTSDGHYVLTVHKSMAFVLISLYAVVIVITVMTLIKMLTNKTGLKWDPVTIADPLALFHGSNALDEFEALEQQHRESAFDLLAERSFRLGYWERTEDRKTRIWYGIGKISPPAGRDPEAGPAASNIPACPQCNRGTHATFCSCKGDTTCTVYPWSKTSLFRPIFIYFWAILIVASLCLCLYTASSSRVSKPFTIHNTWWKYLPNSGFNANSTTNSSTLSPQTNITSQPGDLLLHLQDLSFNAANDLVLYVFVFRSIPVILASYFAITWFSAVDRSTRFSQPFADMYNKSASADDSILLKYLWGMPGLVTIDAFSNGHYKVFWFSLLDLLSPIFPILVGGLFVITNTGEKIVFTIVPVTFYFVLAYLAIYLLTLPFIWPRRNRRLLRWHNSIADYVSLFYASHLLNDTDKEHPEKDTFDISSKDVTERHLYSRVFLEDKRYGMGFYKGVDGRRHWGLERVDFADVEFVGLRDWVREKDREKVEGERVERERVEMEREEWEMVEMEARRAERQIVERAWVEEVVNGGGPATREAP